MYFPNYMVCTYMYVCLFVLTAQQRDERNPLERVAQQQRQERGGEGEGGEGEGREGMNGGEQETNSQRRVESVGDRETQVCLSVE
jgi:hypothetical protein